MINTTSHGRQSICFSAEAEKNRFADYICPAEVKGIRLKLLLILPETNYLDSRYCLPRREIRGSVD
jgi:hypothetical protein